MRNTACVDLWFSTNPPQIRNLFLWIHQSLTSPPSPPHTRHDVTGSDFHYLPPYYSLAVSLAVPYLKVPLAQWMKRRPRVREVMGSISVQWRFRIFSLSHASVMLISSPSTFNHYTLNVWSRGKQLVLFSRKSRCFPRRSRGKHQDLRENKTN